MAEQPRVYQIGGGERRPVEFVTQGNIRTTLLPGDAVWEHAKVLADPDASSRAARTFFRLDENSKWQFCVRFPSGAIQVISTEP